MLLCHFIRVSFLEITHEVLTDLLATFAKPVYVKCSASKHKADLSIIKVFVQSHNIVHAKTIFNVKYVLNFELRLGQSNV